MLWNGRTYRGDVVRWNKENYLLKKPRILVPVKQVAWYSKSRDTGKVIREWWRGIEQRADLEDALLPLARFCLQEGRKEEGMRFARAWCSFRKWRPFLSREFLILTDTGEKTARKVAVRLDAVMNLLRGDFPGGERKLYSCVVRLFAKEQEFHRFCKTAGESPSSTYYSPRLREILMPDMASETLRWTFSGGYREACSFYLVECYLGFVPRYSWVLAGTAACYETACFKKGKVREAWKKRPLYYERIKVVLESGTYVPLKTFLRMEARRFVFGDNYMAHFAQAWSLAWFFHHTPNPAWRDAYFTYLRVLRKEKDDEKALKAAFLPLGLEKLERDWKAFFKVKPGKKGRTRR